MATKPPSPWLSARKIKVTGSNGEEDAGLQPNGCSEPASADGGSLNGASNGETKPSEGSDLDAVQAKLAAREQECRESYDRLLRVTAAN